MEVLKKILPEGLISSSHFFHKALLSAALVLLFVLIHRLVIFLVARSEAEPISKYRARKFSAYLLTFTAVVLIFLIWSTSTAQFVTVVGLASAGLAVAMKDMIVDLMGWLFIMIRRPFSLGDRIEVQGVKGDVVDLRSFQFSLLEVGNWVEADQSTGRIVHVPNRYVFIYHITNYNNGFGFIWNEIPVLITFESNWRKAKRILEDIAQQVSLHFTEEAREALRRKMAKFMIFYRHLSPKVYTSVQESGVLLTIRYLCKPRNRRGTEEQIWEMVLEAFEREPDIDLAYPTYRIYQPESKSEG